MRKNLLKFTLILLSFTGLIILNAHGQSNPGGISGATVWLRADEGVSTTGTNVTSWANQANAANSFVGTGNPQLGLNNINFHT